MLSYPVVQVEAMIYHFLMIEPLNTDLITYGTLSHQNQISKINLLHRPEIKPGKSKNFAG